MATIGSGLVDFGATPVGDAALIITGQAAITAGSSVSAWVVATATADHTADEHWAEALEIVPGNIVAGVGFTIYAVCQLGRATGKYTVQWIWN